jgi:hypothetical protein
MCDSASGTGVRKLLHPAKAWRCPTNYLDINLSIHSAPATLAEFKLNGDGGQDFYDVSNVDGSNLPVRISNNKGCPTPSCGVDLNPGCPDDRMKVRDQNGITIGCLSACQVCTTTWDLLFLARDDMLKVDYSWNLFAGQLGWKPRQFGKLLHWQSQHPKHLSQAGSPVLQLLQEVSIQLCFRITPAWGETD